MADSRWVELDERNQSHGPSHLKLLKKERRPEVHPTVVNRYSSCREFATRPEPRCGGKMSRIPDQSAGWAGTVSGDET